MVQDTIPLEIGGEKYLLHFTDQDVSAIETQYKTIAVLFHPVNFGFDLARIFLWKGLKKQQQDGTLIYACTQDAAGFDHALQLVKQFTGQHVGPIVGVRLLYEATDKALIASGWYKPPAPAEKPKEQGEPARKVDPSKNSQRPTKRPTRS